MNFLQHHFLWFLVLAAIPVILYLLFRRRRNEVDWGASYILRLTVATKKKENFWKQIAIITLRTLALALLVFAFAQPFLKYRKGGQMEGYPRSPGILHRIILVDNSRSMLARDGTLRRLDAARGTIAELLGSTQSGDLCHLILLCPDSKTGAIPVREIACPIAKDRAQSLAAQIDFSNQPIEFSRALRAAADTFRNSFAAQRQLVILSDLCRADHPALDEYSLFGSLFSDLHARVGILNFGSRKVRNLAVEKLTTGSDQLLKGLPTNVRIEVMNYSDSEVDDRRVQFFVDGKQVAESPCLLPVGGRKTFVFPVSLEGPFHRLEGRLSDDALPFDNTLEQFVRVRNSLNLLVVTPDATTGEGFERDEEFLRRATTASQKASYSLGAQFVTASQVVPTQFGEKDVVVLCGISKLPVPIVAELDRFVRRGGGLFLSASPQLDAEQFNQTFGKLLPVRIGAPFRSQFDAERYRSVQAVDIPSLLLREFESSDSGDLSAARIYNHFVSQPWDGESAQSQVLLSLDNGDPLLIERRCGRGSVLLWTTTLGGAWNSLVVRQAYVPLVYRLMNYAGSFHEPPLNVQAGQPLVWGAGDETKELFVSTPDSKLVKCPVVTVAGRRFIRFEQTDVPGRYDLQNQSGKTLVSFSVAALSKESDLRMLEPREMSRLEKALGTTVSVNVEQLKQSLWREGDGREFAGGLLLAVLAMILLDAFLTYWWFSR